MLFLLQTVPLSFTFMFYGHEVKQITIATGGTYVLCLKNYNLGNIYCTQKYCILFSFLKFIVNVDLYNVSRTC